MCVVRVGIEVMVLEVHKVAAGVERRDKLPSPGRVLRDLGLKVSVSGQRKSGEDFLMQMQMQGAMQCKGEYTGVFW